MAIVEKGDGCSAGISKFWRKVLGTPPAKGVVTSMMKRITGVVLKLTAKKRIKLSGTA